MDVIDDFDNGVGVENNCCAYKVWKNEKGNAKRQEKWRNNDT